MKSILIILTIAIAAAVIFNSCKSRTSTAKSTVDVKDLWLNSHRPSAKPNVYSAQFATEYSGEAWQELTIPIEGFTYTAGHIYHLRVEEVGGTETDRVARVGEGAAARGKDGDGFRLKDAEAHPAVLGREAHRAGHYRIGPVLHLGPPDAVAVAVPHHAVDHRVAGAGRVEDHPAAGGAGNGLVA